MFRYASTENWCKECNFLKPYKGDIVLNGHFLQWWFSSENEVLDRKVLDKMEISVKVNVREI
jgi:hypothetical protein